MADPNSVPNLPAETIATSQPVRKINPPAKLTDGNNSMIPVLSSHHEGIAAHAAAQKKAAGPILVPANSTNIEPSIPLPATLPQPTAASATIGPTPTLGSTPGARPSLSHDGGESTKSTSKCATVKDDDSDDEYTILLPKCSKTAQHSM